MTLYRNVAEQIVQAYKQMAKVARYRPAAPSDGFGNISVPLEELDLDKEALIYAHNWNSEEETQNFHIGACNFRTRPATIYAVEAARLLCGVEDEAAKELLQMALDELSSY